MIGWRSFGKIALEASACAGRPTSGETVRGSGWQPPTAMSGLPHSGPTAELNSRVCRFIRATAETLADRALPIDAGVVLDSPSMPGWWDLNHVRIGRPVRFADALDLAEQHLHTLPFRHLVIEHDATAVWLDEPFRTAGWSVERDLLMALRAGPDRPADTSAVSEVDADHQATMMRRWHLEERPDTDEDELGLLERSVAREARRLRERRFGIALPSGESAAITKLRSDGVTAQVEDVYTIPEARGRGLARALIEHAIAVARAERHDVIFIIADADDWPKELYARIGFRAIGRMLNLHRTVP